MLTYKAPSVPSAFIWRRLHSLAGVFLVLFICEHLLTNSQAALWIGDDGAGFVRMVNLIHSLPYLPVIEVGLLGLPILLHALLGVKYLFSSEQNSYGGDGTKPSLGEYGRNRAFTWQRITSWVLLIGITAHVIQMRFLEYPAHADYKGQSWYMVRVEFDEGIYTLADRMKFDFFDKQRIESEEAKVPVPEQSPAFKQLMAQEKGEGLIDPKVMAEKVAEQRKSQHREWIEGLKAKPLGKNEVIIAATTPGTAFLMTVRDTFKSPLMSVIYSIYVLAAVFHAFNGLWTFCITWGVTLSERAQNLMLSLCVALMGGVGFLGLIAIWGTYWVNLYN